MCKVFYLLFYSTLFNFLIFLLNRICLKFGLKTKSYGQNENRHIVISKKENSQEVFEELVNNGFENDYYKLIPPKNEY